MTQDAHRADVDGLIRQRIRGLRQARGWSLDELARRTELSPSTISRIETGGRRLALDHLVRLARTFHTTLDALADTSGDGDVVIRPERSEDSGWTVWPLTREPIPGGVQVAKMRLEPGGGDAELHVHPGRDWFYVLSGVVELTLGERVVLVRAGRAAQFGTMTPHRFVAHRRPAEVLTIFDPSGDRAHSGHG